jgi:hypothetical protein
MEHHELKDEKSAEIVNLELQVEELEERKAPAIIRNHNETLVRDGDLLPDALELEVEELEPIVAPGLRVNHNETLLLDVE